MVLIWHPNCSTCKKAKQWLDARGVACTLRDIRTENPTVEELRDFWNRSGLPLKRFFNTSGQLYRSMELGARLPQMSEEEQLELLSTDGMLVRRPLLVGARGVCVGFREAEWQSLLEQEAP
ncbi:arsenate reductase family protein [Angelakisella massiliensis]|uniref:arsenate reductase family protein n=1 Tax=Angelakisella massiliensis TaxID=1871018 RepID=UPI0008F803C8|nr:arsenate reductase family protein [Angelakisella massiliensis]